MSEEIINDMESRMSSSVKSAKSEMAGMAQLGDAPDILL